MPWQRVINNKGCISPRCVWALFVLIKLLLPALTRQRGPSGAGRQAAALRAEGVEMVEGAMGEFSIDLQRYGWFPSLLPSEAREVEGDDDDEEDEDAAAYHS